MRRSTTLKRDLCAAVVAGILSGLIAAFVYAAIAGAEPVDTGRLDLNQDAYRWALKWERQAATNLRHARNHARMLETKVPKALRARIGGDVTDEAGLYAYGSACKRRAVALRRYINRTWRQMRYPDWRRRGADAWIPLARHAGWPEPAIPMLRRVIHRESNGNPRDVTGHYHGLLQIGTYHTSCNLLNPNTNLRYGLAMWRQKGWAPWAATAW